MMEEDIKIKALLQQWAVEETSADFTLNIMQHIEAEAIAKKRVIPLLKQKLVKILATIFALVLIVLLAVCNTSQPIAFPFIRSIKIPAGYISQITSFIIVFWSVMLANQLYQHKSKPAV